MKESEEELTNWYKWYHYNKSNLPPMDLKKRCDFYEKALDGFTGVLALLMKDIQVIEQRQNPAGLYLPRGVEVSGDITRFG